MSEPYDESSKPRRFDSNGGLREVRTWLGGHKVRIGAILLGCGAFLGYLLSAEKVTWDVLVWGVVLGALASVPAIIIEEAIRSHPRHEGSASPKPAPRHVGPAATASMDSARQTQKGNDSRFRGRRTEIEALMALYHKQVQARAGTDPLLAVGPVVLAIHGMPSVGKSMLARQVGSLLAQEYPDGRLSENFGSAGGPRPPAEILKRFLVKLGRPEGEIPEDVEEQANLFRSLTMGRKILFEFDAARNHDQVLQVLPTEPGCAVIISSRHDLTAQLNAPRGVALGPPQLEDALDILTAVSGFDWRLQAEHAVEVVELCGRLPGAIVAAAERVLQDGTDLRHVAEALQKPADRLSKLDYNGRGVRERYLSEYRRLLPRQQEALCLLTLVESETFIPWVLSPLLRVGSGEAENVMAALGDAQLLENAGQHEATGRARYRFNPLVKLFAQEQLLTIEASVVQAARDELDAQYLALTDEVLTLLDPDCERMADQQMPASMAMVAQLAAERPELYIRREYGNLLRLIPIALRRGNLRLAWRIAALLKGCVPMGEDAPDPRETFEWAIEEAADTSETLLARTDVELALAHYLVAVENYHLAFETLAKVIDRARHESAMTPHQTAEYHKRVVRAQRGIGEAFVQMGDYRSAEAWLDAAAENARDVGSEEEKELVSLLTADAYRIPDREAIYEHLIDGQHIDDYVSFRAMLVHSEDYRRRGQWSQARQDLMAASEHSIGDARRMASVHYRLARLHIDQWRSCQPGQGFPTESGSAPDGAQRPPGLDDLPKMAVREAATSALLFRQMNNVSGVIRARCILARALLTAGLPLAAERLLRTIRQSLLLPDITRSPAYSGLLARYTRAYGELQLHRHILGAAWRNLCHAALRFEFNNDFSSNEEIWQLLETISNHRPYPSDADLPDLAILEFRQEIRVLPPVNVQMAYGIPRPRSPRADDRGPQPPTA